MRICCVGDSITFGYDDEKGGWAERLKKKWAATDEHRVYNLGIPGDTSTGVKTRIFTECHTRKADIIVIAIGINDSRYHNDKPEMTKETFVENLLDIADEALKVTPKLLFVGLTPIEQSMTTPVSWDERYSYKAERVTDFSDLIDGFCKNHKFAFVQVKDCVGVDELPDGLHPNTSAHEKISKKIEHEILRLART